MTVMIFFTKERIMRLLLLLKFKILLIDANVIIKAYKGSHFWKDDQNVETFSKLLIGNYSKTN